jgi:FkbM family methyltransferase
MTYYGQYKQDKYLNENIFKGKDSLYFLDIGSDDGVSLSNTYFFEKELGWKGLLFEPNIDMFTECNKIRVNQVLNIALSNKIGTAKFQKNTGYTRTLSGLIETYDEKYSSPDGRIQREQREYGGSFEVVDVPTTTLNEIFKQFGIKEVDYCSLDTEGSEMMILEGLDFDLNLIKVFTIENNFNEKAPRQFMESKGYRLVKQIEIDDVWVKRGCEYDL